MATSLSERDLVIAAYRRAGHTLRETAREFKVTPERARQIVRKLDRVLRAADKLEQDPTNLQALADFGKLSQRVCSALWHNNGVRSVEGLGSLTRRDLDLLVGVGPKGRREIIDLARRWGIEFPPK
jgi:hypothetical protein